MMGETIIEKIIRHNTGKSVKPGDIVTVNVDRVMIHDIFIPFVAEKFEEMGFSKLYDPKKVILIYDHLVPASQLMIQDIFASVMLCSQIRHAHVHRSDGICHQLMTEAGYVKPGDVVSALTVIQPPTAVSAHFHPVSAIQRWPVFLVQARCGLRCLKPSSRYRGRTSV